MANIDIPSNPHTSPPPESESETVDAARVQVITQRCIQVDIDSLA
jgi:hypothetical protein